MFRRNEKKSINRLMIAFFIVLSALVVAFIFSNSLKGAKATVSQSKSISDVLYNAVGGSISIKKELFHSIIRKVAHMTEFALLGMFIGGIFIFIYLKNGKKYISLPILIGLLVGVCDEYIQSFFTRKSLVSDVLIDFGGVLIGLVITVLATVIINKIRKKR